MHVLVGMTVLTVTAVKNWLMKTMTHLAARKRMMTCKPVECTRVYICVSITFPSLLKCIHIACIDINMLQIIPRSGCMIVLIG